MHLTMLVSFKPFMCVPNTLYSPIVCMKWLCCQNSKARFNVVYIDCVLSFKKNLKHYTFSIKIVY